MKVTCAKFLGLIAGAVLCFASAAFGQDTIGLTSYTSVYPPYVGSLSINGGPASTVGIYCDDDADTISDGESWLVSATDLSAFTGSTYVTSVYYNTTSPSPAVQTENYVEAAYLILQLGGYEAAGMCGSMTCTNVDESSALWDIFNPGLPDASGDATGAAADALAVLSAQAITTGAGLEAATGYDLL